MCARNLIGCIPSEIGRLKRLSSLNLSGNRLSGVTNTHARPAKKSIRPVLLVACLRVSCDLHFLVWTVHLHSTGRIPTALGQLTGLKTMWLSSNRLTGMFCP